MANSLLQRLKLKTPIILAPLARGPSTPELAAAVSNAGRLGSLGLEYLSLDQLRQTIQRTRELTVGPINANLFAPMPRPSAHVDLPAAMTEVAKAHQELAIALPRAAQALTRQLRRNIRRRSRLASGSLQLHFGVMPHDVMLKLKAAGIFVIGTATTVAEALQLEHSGLDAVVAQGAKAGGHRGTFAGPFESSMVPTLELVRGIAQQSKLPIIASGALMDGIDIKRALDGGASAVQLGTAFLATPEASTSKPYRKALLNAREDTTVITRAFSGRPARGLADRFSRTLAEKPNAILPFPLQNSLTRPMRKAAVEKGTSEYLSLWAGTGVTRIRELPAAEIVRLLVAQMDAA